MNFKFDIQFRFPQLHHCEDYNHIYVYQEFYLYLFISDELITKKKLWIILLGESTILKLTTLVKSIFSFG
jgi:hypothetical protein